MTELARLRQKLLIRALEATWVIWLLAAVAILYSHSSDLSRRDYLIFRDTTTLYISGKAWLSGGSPFDSIAAMRETEFGIASKQQDLPNPYPPTAVVLASPASFLPFEAFHLLFDVLYLAALAGSIYFLLRLTLTEPYTFRSICSLFGILLLCAPCRHGFRYGQFDPFILFFTLLGLSTYIQHRARLSGVFLALSVAIKLLGWPVIIALSFRKRRFFEGALFFGCLLGVILITTFNVTSLREYYSKNLSVVLRLNLSVPGNQSFLALANKPWASVKLTKYPNGRVIPWSAPIPESSTITGAIFFTNILLVALALYASRRSDVLSSTGWLLATVVLLGPLIWGFYYLLCLPFLLQFGLRETSRVWLSVFFGFFLFGYIVDCPQVAMQAATWTLERPGSVPMELPWLLFCHTPAFLLAALVARSGWQMRHAPAVEPPPLE